MAAVNDVVCLNVGGMLYTVSRSTLMKFPDTMLAVMLSERWSDNTKNLSEPLFIDRDPLRFRYILDFYRDGHIELPVSVSIAEMEVEIKYFGLPIEVSQLKHNPVTVAAVRNMLSNLDRDMRQRCPEEESHCLGEAAAYSLVPMLLQKYQSLIPKPQRCGLTREDIPNDHWVKALCPSILPNASLKRKATELVESQGYKFSKPISGVAFEIESL